MIYLQKRTLVVEVFNAPILIYKSGRCAVLITGTERSLVTKLDAANFFTEDHLEVEGKIFALLLKVEET